MYLSGTNPETGTNTFSVWEKLYLWIFEVSAAQCYVLVFTLARSGARHFLLTFICQMNDIILLIKPLHYITLQYMIHFLGYILVALRAQRQVRVKLLK